LFYAFTFLTMEEYENKPKEGCEDITPATDEPAAPVGLKDDTMTSWRISY
jgi:hypothetical protein